MTASKLVESETGIQNIGLRYENQGGIKRDKIRIKNEHNNYL